MTPEIQDFIPILKQSGLNTKEIELYTRSLKIGPAKAPELCKYTNISRNMAQYTCQQLTKKSLMTVSPHKNTLIFTAEPPSKLLTLLEEEQQVFQNRRQNLKHAISALSNITPETSQTPPSTTYYQGAAGIIDILKDILSSRDTLLIGLRLDTNIHPEILQYLEQEFFPQRAKKTNEERCILNQSGLSRNVQKFDQKHNRISLIAPNEHFPFECCIILYNNKAALFSIHSSNPMGTIINNHDITNTLRSFFHMSWDTIKRLPENKHKCDVVL